MGGDILLFSAAVIVILAIGDFIWGEIQIHRYKNKKTDKNG